MWHPKVDTQMCWKSHVLVKMHQNWNTPFNSPWHILHWVVTEIFLSPSFFLLFPTLSLFSLPCSFSSSLLPSQIGLRGPSPWLDQKGNQSSWYFFFMFLISPFFFLLFFLKIPQNKTKKNPPSRGKVVTDELSTNKSPKILFKGTYRGGSWTVDSKRIQPLGGNKAPGPCRWRTGLKKGETWWGGDKWEKEETGINGAS